MADKKISELTSITGANVDDANDTIAIVDSSAGQTKKITREELFKDVDGAEFIGSVKLDSSTGDATLSLVSNNNLANAGQKIAFFGANRSDTDEEMASIRGLLASNNGGAGNVQQGELAFSTSGSEALRVDRDGNVGIGTGNPQSKLDVDGGATFAGDISIEKAVGGTIVKLEAPDFSQLRLGADADNRRIIGTSVDGATVYSELLLNEDDIRFRIDTVEAAVVEGAGTSLVDNQAVVTKEKGDARYMQDGAYGLGQTGNGLNLPDLDATDTPSGHYRVINTTPNISSRPSGFGECGYLSVYRYDNTRTKQVYTTTNGLSAERTYNNGAWKDWQSVFPERGSNANGEYVRFPDGTQICTHVLNSSSSGGVTWTFPSAFSTSPDAVSATASAAASRIGTTGSSSTTGITLNGWSETGSRTDTTFTLTAIGTWS